MKDNARPSASRFLIFIGWMIYGQFIALAISDKAVYEFSYQGWLAIREFVPSIARMDRFPYFDQYLPKLHASLMLFSAPVLFVSLLFVDFESSIGDVRKNNKEGLAAVVLLAASSFPLVAVFSLGGPGGVFRSSLGGFAVLSSLITALSVYCFRAAFCLIFNR